MDGQLWWARLGAADTAGQRGDVVGCKTCLWLHLILDWVTNNIVSQWTHRLLGHALELIGGVVHREAVALWHPWFGGDRPAAPPVLFADVADEEQAAAPAPAADPPDPHGDPWAQPDTAWPAPSREGRMPWQLVERDDDVEEVD